ncbi:MAG: prolyl oligopeptidase family serine peptidase [Candidatus Dormibacteraceae bacterium]
MGGPIVAEDIYRFRWIDHVRLSRDGERVAYQVSWADASSRQNRSRIVVRRLLDPEPLEPTASVQRDHSPEWSFDGRRLAFISRVGPSDQLFVADVGTGQTTQLSAIAEGASSPTWSPDGSRIAFIGVVPSDPGAVVDDPRPPDGREQLRRTPVARVVRRLDYKHDGQGFVDGRHHHLFVVSADGGDVTQLTSGAWDVTGFDWAPDSSRLVVAGNAEPGSDLQRELTLYLVDLGGNRQRLGGGFLLSSPIWSPRGDEIAFIAPNGLDAGLLERLWVVPLTGAGPRCLTSNFDRGVNDSVITDMRAGHGTRICWSADGDRIYFVASGPGVTSVYSVDLEGNVHEEVGGRRRIYDFDVSSGVTAFCATDANQPGELHIFTKGAEARLTDLNPWLRDRYVAQPEHHELTAPDGWQLEGWVLKPEGMDPNRLHPMVMEIHGGPHGQYGWAFFHELQVLAGMGYVVFYMNPRGSDGYGERFRREVVRDWGGKDYADLMSSLDQIVERTGYIDSNRMGVGGGSYGGYMTNWILGQTDRFSAAVSMRSISNLVSEYSQHDIVLWGALELGPPPWPDLDELWRRSPIRYVRNYRTPLLLTCGEMDLRCAISQSEELFGALRLLGKTVELVRFPEESHDLSRNGRPDRRVERLRRIAGWYERFLGTAAVDRVSEAATQVLPVPAEAHREWAKTIAMAAAPAVSEVRAPVVPEPAIAPVAEPALDARPAVESAAEAAQGAPSEPETREESITEPAGEPGQETVTESEPEPGLIPAAEAEETVQAAEPHVIQPEIPDEPGTLNQEIGEPEALPVLPEPVLEDVASEAVMAEDSPAGEPVAAEAGPAATEIEPAGASAVEVAPDQAEPALQAEAPGEPIAEAVEAEPAATEPWAELVADESEREPAAAVPEPAPAELEPAVAEGEPEVAEADAEPRVAQAEPRVAQAEPEPTEPEPEAPVAAAQSWVPEPVAPPAGAASSTSSRMPNVTSTIVAWPTGTGAPGNGTGIPQGFEEATSIIQAWQHSPATSKQTVSLQALPPEQVAQGASYAALLTFESGPFAGRIVALPSQMVSMGRAPDNDVVVGDPATSGHHGRIEIRGGYFWISDLGSTNGTLVNGEPVIEKQLSDGDLISVGQNTIRFTLES